MPAVYHEGSLQLVLHKGPDQLESETIGATDIKIIGHPDAIISYDKVDLPILLYCRNLNSAFFSPFECVFIRVREDLVYNECTGNSLVYRKKYFLSMNLAADIVPLVRIYI